MTHDTFRPAGLPGQALNDESPDSIPGTALWLGVAGLIPFVAGAGLIVLAGPVNPETAAHALIAYGAVILSFLGGIHWGVALTRGRTGGARGQTPWYLFSVVPSLVAWCALLFAPVTGLIVLAVSFLAMAIVDTVATRTEQVPGWYLKLRYRLSIVVIVSLLVAAWAQS